MLIGLTLAILMVITFFSIIAGNDFIGIIADDLVDTSAIVNGSTTTFVIDSEMISFGLDPITGGIALIVALAVLGGIITFQVVGTGLSENGSKIIMVSFFYGGIWFILSLLSEPLISAIEVFGGLMWIGLTIFYAIGVVSKYFGGGD